MLGRGSSSCQPLWAEHAKLEVPGSLLPGCRCTSGDQGPECPLCCSQGSVKPCPNKLP